MMMRRFSAVASVVEHDDLQTVTDKLTHHNIGAVVVLSTTGRLVGIITDGDLVKALSRRKSDFFVLTAREIMNSDVQACRSDETELEIMTVMSEKEIRHMVVMLGEGIVGLLTLEEAVKHRLLKIRQLNEQAQKDADNGKRLGILDQHLKESWSIFEVFRVVRSIQEETGLGKLDDRARQLLWVIGDADSDGRQLNVTDLTADNKLGTFPTVRRYLDELVNAGLVENAVAPGGRSRPFKLSELGRLIFGRMTKAVSDTIVPLAAGRYC